MTKVEMIDDSDEEDGATAKDVLRTHTQTMNGEKNVIAGSALKV